jgi:hypothetical protein
MSVVRDLKTTFNHIPLKYRCPIKISSQIGTSTLKISILIPTSQEMMFNGIWVLIGCFFLSAPTSGRNGRNTQLVRDD